MEESKMHIHWWVDKCAVKGCVFPK